MAKKKAAQTGLSVPSGGTFSVRSLNARNLFDEHVNKQGSRLYSLPYAGNVIVGIPIPFPLQYLIGCTVLQLGIVVEANGPPESGKTTLLYEFGRLFRKAGGWLEMVVSENKISEELARSIIGWDVEGLESFNSFFASDLEDMMTEIQSISDRAKQMMKTIHPETKKPLGATFPVLIGVDSIMGTNSVESNKKISEDGSPSRSFPVEALKINPFMKKIAADISTFPQMLFIINHRKEGKKDPSKPYAPVEFTKPGGKQIQFQDTYELIIHGTKAQTHVEPHIDGGLDVFTRTLNIKVGKNSAGISGREVAVPYSWCHRMTNIEMMDGSISRESKQLTIFRWNEATTNLLYAYQQAPQKSKEAGALRMAKLDKILHFRKEKGRYYSKTLGISKEDAVNAAEFGMIVTRTPHVLKELQQHFGIIQGFEWVGDGEDFQKSRVKLMKESAKLAMMRRDNKIADIVHVYQEVDDEDSDAIDAEVLSDTPVTRKELTAKKIINAPKVSKSPNSTGKPRTTKKKSTPKPVVVADADDDDDLSFLDDEEPSAEDTGRYNFLQEGSE